MKKPNNSGKKHWKEEHISEKEKILDIFILVFAIVAIAGFGVSLFFLSRITGRVIGASQENLYGVIVIITILLCFCVVVLLRISIKKRRRKDVDIAKIIEEFRT